MRTMKPARRLAALATLASLLGCKPPDEGDPPPCTNPCDDEDEWFVCKCDVNEDNVWCDESLVGNNVTEYDGCPSGCLPPAAAISACNSICAEVEADVHPAGAYSVDAQTLSCADNGDSGSCSGWDPAGSISYSSGTYYVDNLWLYYTVSDPAPLWTCDDAYVEQVEGGWEVHNASSGEALYELGLRNGDIVESVNSYSLETWDDAVLAFMMLYFGGTSSFTLTIERNSSSTTLSYEKVST